jgi:hypothetical protein
MLKCIPDNEKMIVRDYMKQFDLVYMLKYCALNQWSKNGSLYLHAIKVPYSYINCVNILDPTDQGRRSFVVEYSRGHTIGLNILKDHWVSKVIGRERINEITIYEKELSDFLTVAHYTTFGFFRIQTSGEIYFIMLTPHSYLNMNLVDRSKDGLPKYIC